MAEEPRWLSSINRITPVGAAVIGLLLVLTNPKMLAANAAAGLLIGTAGLGVAGWAAPSPTTPRWRARRLPFRCSRMSQSVVALTITSSDSGNGCIGEVAWYRQ